jgi:formylglycine-generating enzyme required for sulfatase activity
MTGSECHGESCCTALAVSGGTFPFGRDSETCSTCNGSGCPSGVSCNADEMPEHTATVSAFTLDKYEVTVGRFRRFVESYTGVPPAAGAGAHPNVAGSGWQASWDALLPVDADALGVAVTGCGVTDECMAAGTCGLYTWTSAPGDNELRPINCVAWHEAFAFCVWDGGRLPSEAEWEYVAGGSDNFVYPWGNEPGVSPTHAVYDCLGDGIAGCAGLGDFLPVGSKPAGAGPFGHLDLLGSAAEWLLDLYASYTSDACTDCVNTSSGTERANRGGGWALGTAQLRTASRNSHEPGARVVSGGLRCAR